MKPNSATLSNAALGDEAESPYGTAARSWPTDAPSDDRPTTAVQIALIALRAYKLLISPLFTGACRFTPSCSDYTAEAIRRFGVVRGSWVGIKRLGRCHPFCAGGHDPVPPRI